MATNQLGNLSPIEPPRGMANAVAVPDGLPPQAIRKRELQNRILQLTGPNHGAELQEIFRELMSMSSHVAATPEQKAAQDDRALKRFLRPGLSEKVKG